MRRGRWAEALEGSRATGPGFGHFMWQHGVDGIPWETYPSEADGSGSGSPQSGVVGTAEFWKDWGVPQPAGHNPPVWEPLKQPQGSISLASVPLCDPSPFLPSQGAWRRILLPTPTFR